MTGGAACTAAAFAVDAAEAAAAFAVDAAGAAAAFAADAAGAAAAFAAGAAAFAAFAVDAGAASPRSGCAARSSCAPVCSSFTDLRNPLRHRVYSSACSLARDQILQVF